MKLQRNDTTYRGFVELSASEWALCARDLCDVSPSIGRTLSQSTAGHMGPPMQRKRVDAHPMRSCNIPKSDGVKQRSVRKKSLYLGDSSDMIPILNQVRQAIVHVLVNAKWRRYHRSAFAAQNGIARLIRFAGYPPMQKTSGFALNQWSIRVADFCGFPRSGKGWFSA